MSHTGCWRGCWQLSGAICTVFTVFFEGRATWHQKPVQVMQAMLMQQNTSAVYPTGRVALALRARRHAAQLDSPRSRRCFVHLRKDGAPPRFVRGTPCWVSDIAVGSRPETRIKSHSIVYRLSMYPGWRTGPAPVAGRAAAGCPGDLRLGDAGGAGLWRGLAGVHAAGVTAGGTGGVEPLESLEVQSWLQQASSCMGLVACKI